ncbi:hypothetical protein [Citricoccus sp. I39-566]|uniref:alpha/beta hydrolase n=1 Tax=Citricoccus sp. I39-566 TaxID=3073268 RepID=UPI00286A264D|nr:hypothetical protein [Citricoccus sp. I39-566]WMY80059.1 hypothetical protein RE421_16725 [Citricoccus sp. I39-566]
MMPGPRFLLGGACVCLALTAALGRVLRSRVTDARQADRFIEVTEVGADAAGEWVTFPEGSFAAHPGELDLVTAGGRQRLVLGPPEVHMKTIRRRVVAGDTAPLRTEGRGRLGGHLGETPAAFGLPYLEVEEGPQRLWKVGGRPGGRENVWVIHVHGLGSRRSQTLRGVKTVAGLGFTSLVPTYRTSLDALATSRHSHLGLTEWRDVARAQEHALAAGARDIVYVGWSLGASIVLQTLHRAPRPEVRGAVLVSPALDWKSITRAALAGLGVPRWLARWALAGFNLIRWGEPYVRWNELPGVSAGTDPQLPFLVFHGTADRSVPVELSRQLVERNLGHARLVEFDRAHHTLEWNSDPALWDREIESWCEGLGLLVGTPADLLKKVVA